MRKIVSLCLMLVMSMMIWADRTLYFAPNSNWTQANAKFAAYYFDNAAGTNGWSAIMETVENETNLYTTTIPDGFPTVIFVRLNASATEGSWAEGVKWNQSADITLPTDGKDMFTLADGWDRISGTWSNYAAPQQQDTTNVSPLADKHFYLIGEFLNWDTQKALEFTLADSLFTLTVDTLSGIFKVMTVRNWEAPDYGGDYNVNLTLGVPYTLTERGYNLSCSTIYLNAELQLRLVGNDVILTLVSGTPVQQDTTGTNPQDTTQVEMITYYAVNTPRWSLPYAYVWDDVLGAYRTWPGEVMDQTGINFRGYEVYSYTMPKEYTMMIINNGKGGDNNQTPDMVLDTTLRYMYNLQWYASLEAIPADQQDTTGGEPQDTTIVTAERYYLVGMFNNWDASAAVEFQNMDSLYTLTLDTLKGEFKVIDAQDWAHNIYGAWSAFDIPLGGNYGLFNSTKSVNLTLDGDYANVTLNLKKNGNDLFLFFVDGTLIPQDTTATPEPQDSTDVEMITYYAVNTPRWLLPYAYVWKGESESYRPWPGEAMEQTGINFRGYEVYSYTMPKEFTKMIINNAKGGDNNQTPDMVLDTTLRYMYNLQWYASLEAIPADQQDTTGGEPQDTTTVAEITVYTVMPEGWAALNAYVWPDQGTNYVAWPGEAMTPTGLVFRNAAVYSYTFPANYTHIIFNNGEGGQTANLDVNPATPYFYKGEWYASWDEVPEVEPQPQPAEAHYYLVGGFNSWNQNTAIEFSRQDSVYTVTIDTLFGSMKVLVSRETWEGNYGVPSQDDAALTLGEPKALVAYIDGVSYSYDFNVEGTILNAVLNFVVTENGATITLVSGTPYVAPIEDTHYYFIGSVNSWNFETAPEFTYADSIYTLSLDSLYGNFKVTGAHDWNHGNYGAHTSGDVLLLGGEYQMASANSQDLWVDGTYTNVVLALTNTNNVLTIHFLQGTLVQDTVAPQPQPENYYIKNNWNGGEWAWRQMEEVVGMSDDTIVTFWGYTDVFGGVGVNISTAGDNTEPDTWYAINDFIIADGDLVPQAMDSVSFIYDAVNHLVYAFVINRPGDQPVDPQPVVNDITVYTVMPEGWGALNAYIWIGNQGYMVWPGEAMTNTGETFRGDTVYSYTFPETYTSIIFNNGNGEQTIDLTIDTTKLYYYGETWYASWNEVPEEVIILPATYYVSGNENLVTAAGLSPDYAWNAAAIKATSDTLVLNLRANTDYKLRLTLNGTWVSDVKNYYYLTEVTPGLTTDIEANICFTPAEDGPVTIIYNDSVFTVQGNFIVFAKPTYYIKNNWEAGADWTWQQMNAIDNDSIYWGYVGVFGGMGVNIATEGSDSAPTTWFDASSFIVEEGDLIPQPLDTVYFVFDALRESLTAAVINRPGGVEPQPQPETHFYLVGQFNGWDLETAPEFALQDSFVYTMTVDTLFGAMKVVVSRDSWDGNYGVADMNDAVLTIGQAKALVPYLSGISDNFNFSVEGIILNAVLNIVVTDNVVNITLVSGTPYQQPIEDRHFYLVGSFNDWTVTEAPELTLQDSIYTITIDTMAGEFKVVDARDWLHNIYGAYYYGEVLTPGNEYGMAAMNSENFSLITTYTNVTLNLRVENDVVTIIFVSGTPMPTTGLDTAVGNTATPVKLIENGALIILRDGVKYNAAGQRIR